MIWAQSCEKTWWYDEPEERAKKYLKYSSSWKQTFLERPRIRTDGFYLLTTTYWKLLGGESFDRSEKYVKMSYYRYVRFLNHSFQVEYALLNTLPDCISAALYKQEYDSKYPKDKSTSYFKYGRFVAPLTFDDKRLCLGQYIMKKNIVLLKVNAHDMLSFFKCLIDESVDYAQNRMEVLEYW